MQCCFFPMCQAWVSAINKASVDESAPISASMATAFHDNLFFPQMPVPNEDEDFDPECISPNPDTHQ
jgi:hypothetical protein